MKTIIRLSLILACIVILASCGTTSHYPQSRRHPVYERPVVIVRGHVPPGHTRKIYKQRHRSAPVYRHRGTHRPKKNYHYKHDYRRYERPRGKY